MGKTNVGVPPESPLSLVIFFIVMAHILKEIEATLKQELQTDIEILSYVDDIVLCLLDSSGMANIKELLQKANRIVNEVATNHNLPLHPSKHKKIVFNSERKRSGKRKKRMKIERVKWLGIIIDETLYFDNH